MHGASPTAPSHRTDFLGPAPKDEASVASMLWKARHVRTARHSESNREVLRGRRLELIDGLKRDNIADKVGVEETGAVASKK